tara:strand:+ start:1052 stop:1225 length:174 start_codon:yes stop_codon:yes gene_type:complete
MRSFARLFVPTPRREMSFQEMIELRRRRCRDRAAYVFLLVFCAALTVALTLIEGPGF